MGILDIDSSGTNRLNFYVFLLELLASTNPSVNNN